MYTRAIAVLCVCIGIFLLLFAILFMSFVFRVRLVGRSVDFIIILFPF